MKIKTFGYRGLINQISRIEDGFRNLGHEVVESGECDLIYSNDAWYDDAIEYALHYEKAKTIFNLLDLPPDSSNLPKAKDQLSRADCITTISKSVSHQGLNLLKLNLDVIYNPIGDFSLSEVTIGQKTNALLYVGRLFSSNKRFHLIRDSGLSTNIFICGPENPLCGSYCGFQTPEQLEKCYQQSKVLVFPSYYEGLGLPVIEAIVNGVVPIVCTDYNLLHEFDLHEFAAEPTPEALVQKVGKVFQNYDYFFNLIKERRKVYHKKFDKTQIAKNILNVYNKL